MKMMTMSNNKDELLIKMQFSAADKMLRNSACGMQCNVPKQVKWTSYCYRLTYYAKATCPSALLAWLFSVHHHHHHHTGIYNAPITIEQERRSIIYNTIQICNDKNSKIYSTLKAILKRWVFTVAR